MTCEIGNYLLIRKEHSTWSTKMAASGFKMFTADNRVTLSSYVEISGLNLGILASRSIVLTTRLPVLLQFGATNCGI